MLDAVRKTDYIPVVVVSLLGGFIGFQVMKAPPRPRAPVVVEAETSAAEEQRTGAAVTQTANIARGRPPDDVDGTLYISAAPPGYRDVEDIRRRLRMGERGTYVTEALKQLDSSLYRWQDRRTDPIRIWIEQATGSEANDRMHVAREGFADWANVGIPVRFTFVVNPADADVTVRWVETFDTANRLGHTRWVYDQYAWMAKGTGITLATRFPTGQTVNNKLLRGIAAHEVGHMLGLPHSADSTDIMFPQLYVAELSQADRATARLLYSVPAGSIK